ncbi:uncharacterized protein BROUX77_002292 [Berkeleyomyces rouxiae]|uniref:uncharacterized protein n=1 Tax=Berkeleyomyces rouxiae TaxID=2035830 RepID=UPI003B7677F6
MCSAAHEASSIALRSRAEMLLLGGMAYDSSEIRLMASEILACRSSGELPFSTAPLTDPKVIVEDWGILQMLRLARGNPNKKPSPDYERLRAEIKKVFNERDSERSDEAAQNVARERIRFFLKAAAKEGSELHELLSKHKNAPESSNTGKRPASVHIPQQSCMVNHKVPCQLGQSPMATPAPLTAHLPASVWTPHPAMMPCGGHSNPGPVSTEVVDVIRHSVQDAVSKAMQPIYETKEYIAGVLTEVLQLAQTQALAIEQMGAMRSSAETLAEYTDLVLLQLQQTLGDIQAVQREGVEGLRLEQLQLRDEMAGEADETVDLIATNVEERLNQDLEARLAQLLNQLEGEVRHEQGMSRL